MVDLIAATTTRTGLMVQAALDTDHYHDRIKVSDEEYAGVDCTPGEFHGEWNYTIRRRRKIYHIIFFAAPKAFALCSGVCCAYR